ncbi:MULTISPECIES: cryptochrome/photolyase family protein [unclassified Carboxylicivirga]|uniref:cryptochrome/photolyase family protein n=1 Tax=Carboxylicivirga TaxID=1628153 RepID=UPI003D353E5A
MKITIHWFRRDLRLLDNTALNAALRSNKAVLPLFIFDTNIIEELDKDDARLSFIYNQLKKINHTLKQDYNSGVCIEKGCPEAVWKELLEHYDIAEVHYNRDYEPYAMQRDSAIKKMLQEAGVKVVSHRDHVAFEAHKILKKDKKPYTVYTPYKNQWLSHFKSTEHPVSGLADGTFAKYNKTFPALEELGFQPSSIPVPDWSLDKLDEYAAERDIPACDSTTHLGPHLRFGTVSVRQVLAQLKDHHQVFLSELIWREFFQQILVHFPQVVSRNFKPAYDNLAWRNDTTDFERWCTGTTGYPLVDAGMRQLNETGQMHNRVRMVCASFLCKHLLIDWRWGEAYFAQKLLDYELAANNGNWQWAAGTGCDAAPYFRIFNPWEQARKFDPQGLYIRRWVNELDSFQYPPPMVDHKQARARALASYKKALNEKRPPQETAY